MVTLNKKESNRLVRKMLKKEKSPISKQDKKIAREIMKVTRKINQTEVEQRIAKIMAPIHSKHLGNGTGGWNYISWGTFMRTGLKCFEEGEKGRIR